MPALSVSTVLAPFRTSNSSIQLGARFPNSAPTMRKYAFPEAHASRAPSGDQRQPVTLVLVARNRGAAPAGFHEDGIRHHVGGALAVGRPLRPYDRPGGTRRRLLPRRAAGGGDREQAVLVGEQDPGAVRRPARRDLDGGRVVGEESRPAAAHLAHIHSGVEWISAGVRQEPAVRRERGVDLHGRLIGHLERGAERRPRIAATSRGERAEPGAYGERAERDGCQTGAGPRGGGARRSRRRSWRRERRREFPGAAEPVRGELGERGEHRGFEGRRHRLSLPGGRPRLVGQHLGDDRLCRGAGERRLAHQHLVGHARRGRRRRSGR